MLRFDGRVALITGATFGIGRAYAELLGSRGAKIIVNCRKENDAAHEVVEKIKASGGDAIIVTGDVGEEDTIKRMVDTAIKEWGRIDIAVSNAAGTYPMSLPWEDSSKTIDRVFDVHVRATLKMNEYVWPYMKEQGYGRILVTGSAGGTGYIALPEGYTLDYALCKASIFGVVRQTAAEGMAHNIKCNMVLPWAYGKMVADFIGGSELGKWMEANVRTDQVAAAVAPLLHEDCPTTGETITAGGGRVGRIFFAATRGYFDRDLTAEKAFENWDKIMGTYGEDGTLLDVFEQTQPREEAMMGYLLETGDFPDLTTISTMPLKGNSKSMNA